MSSTPTASAWSSSCQPADGGGAPQIVRGITMTKDEALAELRTLSGDEAWLAWATGGLKDRGE